METPQAAPQTAPKPRLTVGSKVTFHRGMFGEWPGTIRQIYQGRTHGLCGWAGVPMAVVSYTRANGTFGKKRCALSSLTPRSIAT